MNAEDFRTLFAYSQWANGRLIGAAQQVDPEDFARDLGASFKSLKGTLLHILGGEWKWLQFWRGEASTNLFAPEEFPDASAIDTRRLVLEREQRVFTDTLTDELLERRYSVKDRDYSLGQTMQHLFNHSTYHRGQVALLLRQLGHIPPATDYRVFLDSTGAASPVPEAGASAGGRVLETERLVLRRLTVEDAAFMLGLLNEPSWLRFIGDRGVRTLEDAGTYIVKGPVDMYERLGFGLYATTLKEDDSVPIGICGLVKRDGLEDVDIGFAFLPKFWGKGYACEAASAVMAYAKSTVGLKRIVAITAVDNESAARLLEKVGLRFEKMVRLTDEGEEVRLFAWEG